MKGAIALFLIRAMALDAIILQVSMERTVELDGHGEPLNAPDKEQKGGQKPNSEIHEEIFGSAFGFESGQGAA